MLKVRARSAVLSPVVSRLTPPRPDGERVPEGRVRGAVTGAVCYAVRVALVGSTEGQVEGDGRVRT